MKTDQTVYLRMSELTGQVVYEVLGKSIGHLFKLYLN